MRFVERVGLARIPVLSTAANLALRRVSKCMAEMMGDVVIYSTADVGSRSYAIRQRLRKGAVEELVALCEREDKDSFIVDSPIERGLDGARWLNFYHLPDPVGGHLDAYAVDKKILGDMKVKGSAKAHSAYWALDAMYEAIGAEFFSGLPDLSRA